MKNKRSKWLIISGILVLIVLLLSRSNPGILTLLPPIITIALALITQQVVLSLLLGLFTGVLLLFGFNPGISFMRTLDVYVIDSLASKSHAAILIFTTCIAGMISIVSRIGGTRAIAEKLIKSAKTPRSAQIITMLLGCIVFFDDYANILVVGPTMRPLTDKLKISREKLAYYVHTTAGIVAGIAIMTTWIGFEMSLVSDAFYELGHEVNAFAMILKNIPFMFYNIFAIVISFLLAYKMKDFGPMYAAEKRARLTGKVHADDAKISVSDEELEYGGGKVYYAVLPIVTMIAVTFFGIWYAGSMGNPDINPFSFEGFRTAFGDADPMPVLVWAAVSSSFVAGIIGILKEKLSISDIFESWINGAKELFEVCVVLILAWALGSVLSEIGTADFLITSLTTSIPGALIPMMVFILACLISFSTGSSWGTMPIVFPLAIPLAAAYTSDPTQSTLVIATIAATLSGSIFGDQTSPISDSSILSASATGCDLIHHVKTQIPYALVPAAFAVLCYLIVGFTGLTVIVPLILGSVGIYFVVHYFGKSTKEEDLIKIEDKIKVS
ncbi:Na+/H+ antiporter NhaC family protein [Acidaminobacter sp. JC074]|uniref:Na+/H+ antiporter NhaC family protein n=1 Tax=Acidaminobacter sp. JC074 TaxID=2530199 RepID=UPI001F0ED1CD|nr:Na+/H+ antiporter NhaC family protein [Acidaminobacter sp. JC074]MCH4886386.1 Na+/H+ antiporter NhaC family protein [Acidaminobacter sp. JC074]